MDNYDFLLDRLFFFTYSQIFFVISDGAIDLLPMMDSIESFRPENEMLYPPNAGFAAMCPQLPCALRN